MGDTPIKISRRLAFATVFLLGISFGTVIGGASTITLQNNPGSLPDIEQLAPTDNQEPNQPSQDDTETEPVSVSDLNITDERTMGAQDAPVTLVYFGDFNCMYCYRFAQQTLPQLRDTFVQSGDVKIVYKNLITMGQNSITLAKASEAAWDMVGETDPDTYWAFHSQLHDDQQIRKQNEQSVMQDIMDTASKVEGIDEETLRTTMDKISDETVTQDIQQARQRGITGTPGFVLFESQSDTGTPIQGAQPYSTFETEITELLDNN
ncbi:MAG: thioredoxin domain-containing protein [Candidatus Nanohaloarchaeota archaeon QJJ-5]|nr:thioredoxin domain-containing protein [Candidatus Nanohaloarchaeota archaeon QJJ-5]